MDNNKGVAQIGEEILKVVEEKVEECSLLEDKYRILFPNLQQIEKSLAHSE